MLTGASIMAYSDDVLRYNSYGKQYEVPRRRVFHLYELHRGDHIAFHRFKGAYWHHAIVKRVYSDAKDDVILTIEYNKDPLTGEFKVMEKENLLQEATVHLMLHKSFDRHLVLRRAQSKIGEAKYNPVLNNCEHFAMWCITGRSSCDQVNKGLQMVIEEVVNGITRKLAARTAAKLAAQGFGRIITGVGTLHSQAAFCEVLSMVSDINNLLLRQIDQKGLKKTVMKRVLTGASGVAGSTMGMAAGQALIPFPGVGAAIGGAAGALVGRYVGNLAGNKVCDNDKGKISEKDLGGDGDDVLLLCLDTDEDNEVDNE